MTATVMSPLHMHIPILRQHFHPRRSIHTHTLHPTHTLHRPAPLTIRISTMHQHIHIHILTHIHIHHRSSTADSRTWTRRLMPHHMSLITQAAMPRNLQLDATSEAHLSLSILTLLKMAPCCPRSPQIFYRLQMQSRPATSSVMTNISRSIIMLDTPIRMCMKVIVTICGVFFCMLWQ
jgi:hypothetical protein